VAWPDVIAPEFSTGGKAKNTPNVAWPDVITPEFSTGGKAKKYPERGVA